MKKILLSAAVFSFLFSVVVLADPNNYQVENYQVCFTPGGNCTQDIVNAIDGAKKQVLVQAYSFTSVPIAKALLEAHRRGVDVRVILDKSQKTQRYSSAKFLENQDIKTWIDYRVAIAHNKVMIIDGAVVITGSFNFTKAAQYKNAENLIIIHDAKLASIYQQNWNNRLQYSVPSDEYKKKA